MDGRLAWWPASTRPRRFAIPAARAAYSRFSATGIKSRAARY